MTRKRPLQALLGLLAAAMTTKHCVTTSLASEVLLRKFSIRSRLDTVDVESSNVLTGNVMHPVRTLRIRGGNAGFDHAGHVRDSEFTDVTVVPGKFMMDFMCMYIRVNTLTYTHT